MHLSGIESVTRFSSNMVYIILIVISTVSIVHLIIIYTICILFIDIISNIIYDIGGV